ncbi:MAG: trypsin-like peptidase domain-containing protein [Limnochordales bacterium]|nr:trypsin-like peptidase domain-containing protein [Limnochordales bacterium]
MSAPSSPPRKWFFFSSGILPVLLMLVTAPPARTTTPAFPVFALVEITAEFPAPSLPSVFSRPLGIDLFAEDWSRTPWTYPPDPRALRRVGLGILIDPRGYILTSQHLVGYPGDHQKLNARILSPVATDPATAAGLASATPALTVTGAGTPLAVRLVAVDPVHDLALLLTSEPPAYRPNSPELVASLLPLEPGSAVSLVGGSVAGSDLSGLTLLPGEVTRYNRWPSADAQATAHLIDPLLGETREVSGLVPIRLLQVPVLAAAATSTSSTGFAAPLPGGPAFDRNGQVVGLVTGLVATSDPDLAFLVPLQVGLQLMSDWQASEERFRRVKDE